MRRCTWMATILNALMLERLEFDWARPRYAGLRRRSKVVDGHIALPTVPGLGRHIVEDEIAKYPSRVSLRNDEGVYEPGTHGESVYFQTACDGRPRFGRTRS